MLKSRDSEAGRLGLEPDTGKKLGLESEAEESMLPQRGIWAKLDGFSQKLDSFGVETRGIHRVAPYDRRSGDLRQVLTMVLFWVSGCGGLPSMSGYFLGPLVFGLGFKDAMSSAIAGTFLGTGVCAYGAVMGPRSGLRQMVGCRFQFGWWPAKVFALLNVLTLLGWSVVNCVFGGQILAALSQGKLPLELGIVIITVISFCIAVFGIRYVQFFESFAAIPVLLTFMLLYVAAGSNFFPNTVSTGNAETIRANWITFFSSCFGVTATWIAIASDYYVEFPETTPKVKVLLLTWGAIFVPTMFVGILGIGLASGATMIPAWSNAFENLGNGGLLTISFSNWHAGGKFLLVVLYISLVSNNILNTYSIALSSQVWGLFMTRIPRYILAVFAAAAYFVLSMVGRNHLSTILGNFLPMITYWCVIYFFILLEENMLFRRTNLPGLKDAYDWEIWNKPHLMPSCYAAVASALCGVAGAVLGMCQVYYTGPVAKLVGDNGADVGVFLSGGFTLVTYAPFRWIELKYKKRRGIRVA